MQSLAFQEYGYITPSPLIKHPVCSYEANEFISHKIFKGNTFSNDLLLWFLIDIHNAFTVKY